MLSALRAALARGTCVDDTSGIRREPALVAACRGGHALAVGELLDAGANACVRTDLPSDEAPGSLHAAVMLAHMVTLGSRSTTALHVAAAVPDARGTACVAALLERRPRLAILGDSFLETPIEAALAGGNVASARLLLDALAARGEEEAGAINVRSGAWLRAACTGCNGGNLAPLELLVERGLHADGLPLGALLSAPSSVGVPLLARLLQLGVDASASVCRGPNALAELAGMGNVAAVEFLLSRGCDPRLRWLRRRDKYDKYKEPGLPHEHLLTPWLLAGDSGALTKAALNIAQTVGAATRPAAGERRLCSLCGDSFECGITLLGAPAICTRCPYAECVRCMLRLEDAARHARSSPFPGSGRCRALLEVRAAALTAIDGGCVALVPRAPLPHAVGLLTEASECTAAAASSSDDTDAALHPHGVTIAGIREFIARVGGMDIVSGLKTREVNEVFIQPLTEDTRDSYLEHMQREGSAHTGPATVFVSHAWEYRFVEDTLASIETWEAADVSRSNSVYWFDVFTNSQHDTPTKPFEWWRSVFRSSIQRIGQTLLVLPWDAPVAISRAWCVFELFCSRAPLHISMPASSTASFSAALVRDVFAAAASVADFAAPEALSRQRVVFDFSTHLASVNLAECNASNPSDKVNIMRGIRWSGGIVAVNDSVTEALMCWVEAESARTLAQLPQRDARALLSSCPSTLAHLKGCSVQDAARAIAAMGDADVQRALAAITPFILAVVLGRAQITLAADRAKKGFVSVFANSATSIGGTSVIKRSLLAVRITTPHAHETVEQYLKSARACGVCASALPRGALAWCCPREECGFNECGACHAARKGAR